jgi:hypothetical protein
MMTNIHSDGANSNNNDERKDVGMYVHVCMHVYMYVCKCIYICIYVCFSIFIRMNIYVCM